MRNKESDVESFMKIAILEAKYGMKYKHGGPFGAVIVKDGKVVARAHNEVLKRNDSTKHAEILAIQKASKKLGTWNLYGCTLYTTSIPCPMCKSALDWAKIKKIYYGTSAEDLEEIGFDEKTGNNRTPSGKKKEVYRRQTNWEECKKLLEEYNGDIY